MGFARRLWSSAAPRIEETMPAFHVLGAALPHDLQGGAGFPCDSANLRHPSMNSKAEHYRHVTLIAILRFPSSIIFFPQSVGVACAPHEGILQHTTQPHYASSNVYPPSITAAETPSEQS